jgi:hypothetical protein
MFRRSLATLVLTFGFVVSAQAALRYDSSTTLSDESGGSMVTRSIGTFAAESGSGRSDATFNHFTPRANGSTVNGSMSRNREREGDLLSVNYAGNLTLAQPASGSQPARTLTVVFDDISVTRSGEGRSITGHLTLNGREMPAEDAPRSIIAILIGLVKLMNV